MKKLAARFSALLLVVFLCLQMLGPVSAADEILLAQDFSELGELSGWSGSVSDWNVENARLTSSGPCNTIIYAGSSQWSDYSCAAQVQWSADEAVATCLLFRVQDENNFYMMSYTADEQFIQLYKRVGGVYQKLGETAYPLDSGGTYTFQATVDGNRIQCYVDGERVIDQTDSTYAAGKVGFRIYSAISGSEAYFYNISVQREEGAEGTVWFSEPFDTLDPAVWAERQDGDFFLLPLSGDSWLASRRDGILAAGDSSWQDYEVTANVRMTGSGEWNAPGLLFRYQDAGNFYLFQYSDYEKLVRLYKRVDNVFTVLAEAGYEQPKDSDFTYRVHLYGSTITCYVDGNTVLQIDDDTYGAGKIGVRSYVNNQPDNYALLDDIRVTPVTGEAEVVERPPVGAFFFDSFSQGLSRWEAAEDAFTWDGQAALAPDTGAAMMTAGDAAWQEYRVAATFSAGQGAMGVVSCYADSTAYYLAQADFDRETVSLYKGEQLLATKNWPLGSETTLELTVSGGDLKVWADGSKMLEFHDDAVLPGGKIGLYAENAAGGRILQAGAYEIGVRDALPGDYPYEPAPDAMTQMPQVTDAAFYVAENGDDSWSGTLDRPNAERTDGPFATLARAAEAVFAAQATQPNRDYVVMLRGGTYRLEDTLKLSQGGVDGSRVTFAAYPGETPVLSGGKPVETAWTAASGGLWKTTLPASFDAVEVRQLFVNGTRATRSREPDGETWTVQAVDTQDYAWIRPYGDIPETWEGLQGVEMNSRGTWHYNRQTVAGFDAATDTVRSNLYIGVQASGLKIQPGDRGWAGSDWLYFENALIFVDTPGEWYYDAATRELYYYPEDGVDPNTLEMVIPTLETLVEVQGTRDEPVEGLDFCGISFCHTTWSMPEDIERRGIQGGFWGNLREDPVFAPPAAILVENAVSTRMQSCTFSQMGEGAVALGAGAHSSLIYGCEFDDVGANCIQVGWRATYTGYGHPLEKEWDDDSDAPRGNEIVENYIHDCCTVDQGSVGIWVGYANHTSLVRNTIVNMPYSGMNVGWRWSRPNEYGNAYNTTSSHHNLILRNYVKDAMQTMADGGSIYCVGEQYGNRILHNYVDGSLGTGIYLDECSNYTEVGYNYYTNITLADFNLNTIYSGAETNDFHDHHIDQAPPDLGGVGCTVACGAQGDAFAVNFTTVPAEASIQVQCEGDVMEPSVTSPSAYQLPNGTYTYTVTAEGYSTAQGSFTVENAIVDLEVRLQGEAPHSHQLEYVLPEAATCVAQGHEGYWHCVDESCGKWFRDAGGVDEITDQTSVVTPLDPKNHTGGTEIRGKKEPTRWGTGYTGDVYCKGCGEKIASGRVLPEKEQGSVRVPETPSVAEKELPFEDVDPDQWYYESVYEAWELGLLDGMTETSYDPDGSLSVAQAIKLAAVLHQTARKGAADLQNGTPCWYTPYVAYAVEQGIVEAEYLQKTHQELSEAVSRRELVHILFGAMDDYPVLHPLEDGAIPDVPQGSPNAGEVYAFYRAGILTGMDDRGTFCGEKGVRRSEVAAILVRLHDPARRL